MNSIGEKQKAEIEKGEIMKTANETTDHGTTDNRTGRWRRGWAESWAQVPAAERRVLGDLLRGVRSLKGSQVPGVGRAARLWECALVFFIKSRLMNRGNESRKQKAESKNGTAAWA